MKSCDVIAYTSKEGKVMPFKIRVYEGDETNVFTINSCKEMPQYYKQNDIKRYKCRSVINDEIKEYELIFHKNDMKWFIKE